MGGAAEKETSAEFCDKFWFCYRADWCVWPAAQYVNFAFLAPKYRVVYVSFVSALWDIFLSYAKFDEGATDSSVEVAPNTVVTSSTVSTTSATSVATTSLSTSAACIETFE